MSWAKRIALRYRTGSNLMTLSPTTYTHIFGLTAGALLHRKGETSSWLGERARVGVRGGYLRWAAEAEVGAPCATRVALWGTVAYPELILMPARASLSGYPRRGLNPRVC